MQVEVFGVDSDTLPAKRVLLKNVRINPKNTIKAYADTHPFQLTFDAESSVEELSPEEFTSKLSALGEEFAGMVMNITPATSWREGEPVIGAFKVQSMRTRALISDDGPKGDVLAYRCLCLIGEPREFDLIIGTDEELSSVVGHPVQVGDSVVVENLRVKAILAGQ